MDHKTVPQHFALPLMYVFLRIRWEQPPHLKYLFTLDQMWLSYESKGDLFLLHTLNSDLRATQTFPFLISFMF